MAESIHDITVLGAGYAGVACALAVAAREPDRRVTLVDARGEFQERIRLHQLATGQVLARHDLADLCAGTSVRFVRARVLDVDTGARRVHTSEGELAYDRLVVALGSSSGSPALLGAAQHAHMIDVEAHARRLAHALERSGPGARVVVVGAGATGIELAAEIADRRPELVVTLVTRGRLGAGLFSPGGVTRLRRSFARLGVQVIEEFDATAIESSRVVADGGAIAFDVCVYAGGFVASPIAATLGLPVDAAGRLLVDATGRAHDDPRIYGIGDVAVPADSLGAAPLMSCRLALPRAANVAANLVAECHDRPLRPWKIVDVLRCFSLGRRDGLVQFHAGDGRLRNASIGGTPAAWLKEQICRYTVSTLLRARDRARRAAGSLPAAPVRATLGGT